MYNEFTQKDFESLKRYVFKHLSDDVSMLDLIIEYADRHNFFVNEIADYIRADSKFKDLFEKNLQKHKQIYYIDENGITYGKKGADIW